MTIIKSPDHNHSTSTDFSHIVNETYTPGPADGDLNISSVHPAWRETWTGTQNSGRLSYTSEVPGITSDSSIYTTVAYDNSTTLYAHYMALVAPSFLTMAVASVAVLILVVTLVTCFRRKQHYQKIPTAESVSYDYIYKPLQGNILDEEYENTFVGVSIPLLQDNTRI